jgi:glycosyltransferase involved in cell wall biosynthesis
MKILMLNYEFPPLGGGTGTVNKELFKQFKNTPNLTIDLITSHRGNKKVIEQFSPTIRIIKYPVNNKNIHYSSNSELIKYILQAIFGSYKYHRKEKYDFCMAWSGVPAGFVAYLLSIFTKLPYFVRVGGSDIPGYSKRYKNLYKIITPIIKRIWKKSLFIVSKCKIEKEMVREINRDKEIKTIFNGVNVETFNGIQTFQNKILKIICSARLIERKGQDTLIDAIAILKEKNIHYMVDLVGEGDLKELFQKLASEKGVVEQINFCGYIPREKMPEMYSNADIFVLPSYNEGMSNALLEAMASALPVVVTHVGGTEELVDDTNGFVFDAGQTNQLVEILETIHHNKANIKFLGQNSRKKAEELSWKKISEQYLSIFKSIKENSSQY